MKLIRGGMLTVAVAIVMLAVMPARADVTVSIDQEDGATMFSVPTLPDGVEYPPEVVHTFTGTASFASADGSVFLQLSQTPAVNPEDPTTPAEDLVLITGQADLTCNESFACTWSWRIPFILAPGDYTATATAGEPNVEDPDLPGPSQSASVTVTIL